MSTFDIPRELKRSPRPARRHYSQGELRVVQNATTVVAESVTGRSTEAIRIKAKRLSEGLSNGEHARDGRRKYHDQEKSLATATRHNLPWEPWEIDFLIHAYDEGYTPLEQAVFLKRTYRAVEDKRKKIWRKIDKSRAARTLPRPLPPAPR